MLRKIRDLCLQLAPADLIISHIVQLCDWPSLSCQDTVLVQCFNYSEFGEQNSSEGYLPSKAWLKHIAKKLESSILNSVTDGTDDIFSDSFTKFMIEAKLSRLDDDDSAYVSYRSILDGNCLCTLKVLRYHNQVGTKVWEAGLFLAELLLLSNLNFADRIIVELGAGVGVTGLIYMKSIFASPNMPRKYMMTDFDQTVLENLANNIQLNFPWQQNAESSAVLARALDWSMLSEINVRAMNADIILAADCTYSEDTNTHLVKCIRLFLEYKNASRADRADCVRNNNAIDGSLSAVESIVSKGIPFAVVACTVRNPATYNDFIEKLNQTIGLSWSDETEWAVAVVPVPIYYYENRSQIKVIVVF